MDKKSILQILKRNMNHNQLNLPEDIQFDLQDSTLTMELSHAAVGLEEKTVNMQDNPAAFEIWALGLYAHVLNEIGIILLKAPVRKATSTQSDKNLGHYHRFLYRAMKFSEQFPWFRLDDELNHTVAQLRSDLQKIKFVNNLGEAPAGKSNKLESAVESFFAEKDPDLLRKIASDSGVSIGDNPIYRQLPVGLFQEKTSKPTSFFSGGKSAIDLWTYSDSTITIFELKAEQKMVGMVTELFFYANYVYDMFCDINTTFYPQLPKKFKNDRGYSELLSPEGKKIYKNILACFLYNDNQIHPLISKQVLALLNQGLEQIQYSAVSYPLGVIRNILE